MKRAQTTGERKTRLPFRILAGVIAAFVLVVGLPLAIREALLGGWVGWFLPLCCLLTGIGMAEGARTGEWLFSYSRLFPPRTE